MCPNELEVWLNHFEHHARHARTAPQADDGDPTPEECRQIARSMTTLELAGQSDRLMLAARRRADAPPALLRIVELLSSEQHRHDAQLHAFIRYRGVVPTRGGDGVGPALGLLDLEFRLTRLVGAELIGTVYYRALGSVSGNARLKLLCRTLVADGLARIGFESHLLLDLGSRRSAPARALARFASRGLFAVSAALAWYAHRGLLRRAGHGRRSFLRACQEQYDFYLEPAGGRSGRQLTTGGAADATPPYP
jgi:hypothetical protein